MCPHIIYVLIVLPAVCSLQVRRSFSNRSVVDDATDNGLREFEKITFYRAAIDVGQFRIDHRRHHDNVLQFFRSITREPSIFVRQMVRRAHHVRHNHVQFRGNRIGKYIMYTRSRIYFKRKPAVLRVSNTRVRSLKSWQTIRRK